MNILCENIRALRKVRGLTQKELADQLGISDKTVSRWESGVQLPEASLLPALSAVLGVDINTLYGIEAPISDPTPDPPKSPPPHKDEKKNVLDFKIWMIAGTLTSLLGSLLYRYFGSTVFLTPRLIEAEYYNTAKGTLADIFAFVGIVAIFAGIAAVIITKVRFSMFFKPHMPDAIFAENVRFTGAVVVVYSVIFLKTAPEILSFGFYVSREVYGCIFVAALTGVLLWYRRQLKKREIALTKPVAPIALITGAIGIVMSVTALILRDSLTFTTVTGQGINFSGSGSVSTAGVAIAAIMLTVSDWLILAMPVILYIDLLLRLRKIR